MRCTVYFLFGLTVCILLAGCGRETRDSNQHDETSAGQAGTSAGGVTESGGSPSIGGSVGSDLCGPTPLDGTAGEPTTSGGSGGRITIGGAAGDAGTTSIAGAAGQAVSGAAGQPSSGGMSGSAGQLSTGGSAGYAGTEIVEAGAAGIITVGGASGSAGALNTLTCTVQTAQERCGDLPCADGYCCDVPCDTPCMACDIPGHEGTCTAVPEGTDLHSDCGNALDIKPCGQTGFCNGYGACELAPAGTSCGDVVDCAELLCDGTGNCQRVPYPDFTSCEIVTDPDRSYDVCVQGECVSPGPDDRVLGPHFALPDTGQRLCYDDQYALAICPGTAGTDACGTTRYCGQDAQYGSDAAIMASGRYVRTEPVGEQFVVVDKATDLMWQGCPSGMNGNDCQSGTPLYHGWTAANQYCEDLSWGGFDDWHLPNFSQLALLILKDGSVPATDNSVFPGTIPPEGKISEMGVYWTSTISESGSARYFDFEDGASNSRSIEHPFEYLARCFRYNAPPDSRFSRMEPVSNEPVVHDSVIGLTWQGCAAGLSGSDCSTGTVQEYTYSDSFAYCEDLTWGGFDDWRMADMYEMESVINYGIGLPTVDLRVFPDVPSANYYWTGTRGYHPVDMIVISWYGGWFGQLIRSEAIPVRCIRGEPTPVPAERMLRTEPVPDEPVVEDLVTGLMWQGCLAGQSSSDCTAGAELEFLWGDALAYCEQSTWGGFDDWRMPNTREQLSITGYVMRYFYRDDPFPETSTSWEWTSTTIVDDHINPYVNVIEYFEADWGIGVKSETSITQHALRCVRTGS